MSDVRKCSVVVMCFGDQKIYCDQVEGHSGNSHSFYNDGRLFGPVRAQSKSAGRTIPRTDEDSGGSPERK